MYQAGFGIDANVRFHPEEILISFLRLMHFWITFAVFVFGRARRMNNRRIDQGVLT
ncbi:hypothetical protein D3C86_2211820 [compost metagenome]